MPSTLFDKIWDAHEVAPGLLYVDLHLVHEVTSPQAFESLRLDEGGGSVAIVRAEERRKGPGGTKGHRYELLTPPLPGLRAEVSRHVLAAGAETGGPGDPPMHEPGSRETALVESGAVELVIDGERHALGAGDCVTFDADLPHHFENPGPGEAALLAVVSAGLRRS